MLPIRPYEHCRLLLLHLIILFLQLLSLPFSHTPSPLFLTACMVTVFTSWSHASLKIATPYCNYLHTWSSLDHLGLFLQHINLLSKQPFDLTYHFQCSFSAPTLDLWIVLLSLQLMIGRWLYSYRLPVYSYIDISVSAEWGIRCPL